MREPGAQAGVRRLSFHAQPPRRELALEAALTAVRERTLAYLKAYPARREHVELSGAGAESPAVHGRILAQTVEADRDWPPFRRAMRDGYALRSAEAENGQALRCAGQIQAGADAGRELAPGTCLEIMTGAPVPAGADTVVMIEHTRRTGDQVWFDLPLRHGDNIAAPGSDSPRGAAVASAGQPITPALLALLAQAGAVYPEVYEAPTIAILTTGDELVEASQTPNASQIRNSNGPMLGALAHTAGANLRVERQIGDADGELRQAVQQACARAEVIVCSGGASVGAHDGVAPMLEALGAEVYFDAVSIRPGRPQWFARLRTALGDRLFFGLPGNPLGAWLGFTLFVRPALELLSGLDPARLPARFTAARLGYDFQHKALPLRVFRPVRLEPRGFEPPRAQAIPYHGSADLAAAAAADAWLVIPPQTPSIPSGAAVTVLRP